MAKAPCLTVYAGALSHARLFGVRSPGTIHRTLRSFLWRRPAPKGTVAPDLVRSVLLNFTAHLELSGIFPGKQQQGGNTSFTLPRHLYGTIED